MSIDQKRDVLDLIKSNIEKFGYHITTVQSSIEPRYAYTIGLSESAGFELIFAGGVYYLQEEVHSIIQGIVKKILDEKMAPNRVIAIDKLGSFILSEVHPSWSNIMMLGALDYYNKDKVKSLQIIPDTNHRTLDIPEMNKAFVISNESIWQWLVKEWNFPIPKESTAVTNLEALMGETVTEVMRWENDEWEMFAGDGTQVSKEEMRVISVGTMIGMDKTLFPAVDLEIGQGIWRENRDTEWNPWHQ